MLHCMPPALAIAWEEGFMNACAEPCMPGLSKILCHS